MLLTVAALCAIAGGPLAPPLHAQEAGPPAAEVPAPEPDLEQMMDQMGMAEKDKVMFRLMTQAMDMDPAQVMLLMMMAGQGGGGGDAMGMLLFSQLLKGGAGKQPAAVLQGDMLLVIEDGMVYRINVGDLKVEASAPYRPPKRGMGAMADLAPFLAQAREQAMLASCESNLKQVGLAAMMYAQDWEGTLPTEGWVQQLEPYTKNPAIYACPGAAGNPIGYAINEKLMGAKLADIANPAETVLFFESDQGADLPFGGPDALIAALRHGGMVGVAFADGHVQAMPLEKAREALAREIGQ